MKKETIMHKRLSFFVFIMLLSSFHFAKADDLLPKKDFCDDVPRALILSGGGAKGAYEVGAIYHLIKHRNCDFQDISGVSVGALNGAILSQAPKGKSPDESLNNMKLSAENLLKFWTGLRNNDDIYRQRFLGEFGFVIFSLSSLYDSFPLKEKIRNAVIPTQIANIGRNFRVGLVSMADGRYYEVEPVEYNGKDLACKKNMNEKFRSAILASASMPVFFPTPYIRDVTNMASCQNDILEYSPDPDFEPFADGGVSHITPLPEYFDQQIFIPMLASTDDNFTGGIKNPNYQGLPPHKPPIKDLIVILASPYDPLTSAPVKPDIKDITNWNLPGGLELATSSVGRLSNSPMRWDINYGLFANQVLDLQHSATDLSKAVQEKNLDNLKSKLKESLDELKLVSANPGAIPHESSLKYKLLYISPKKDVGSLPPSHTKCIDLPHIYTGDDDTSCIDPKGMETLEFNPVKIKRAIKQGCLDANKKLMEDKDPWTDKKHLCETIFN